MSKIIELREVTELITKGTTPTTVGGTFTDSGINFVKSESICGSKYLDPSVFMKIDEDTDKKLKRSRLEEGDLLVSIAGAYLGKLSIVRESDLPANTNQAVGIVRVNKAKADVNYLYYYFSQPLVNEYINKLSAQSSQPNLNLDLLGKLTFNFVDRECQKSIADVLSSIDDKIELNNRINAELELMAKTLYDYWFVQFDFPDLNGKPYRASGGKMFYNAALKREIPAGWEAKQIGHIVRVKAGGDKPSEFSEVKTNKNLIPIYSNGVSEDGLYGYTNQAIIDQPSITISARGTIGFSVLRMKPFVPIIRLIVLTPFVETDLKFLHETIKWIGFENSGSVQQQLTVPQISSLYVPYPPSEYREKYADLVASSVIKIELIKEQNEELKRLRDWLLPMLMNGQVTVK